MKLSIAAILALCLLAPLQLWGQSWSTFLDPSRALDWSTAGFSIPSYTVNCATQLTGINALVSGSGAASGNAAKIAAAIASCDATHNVVLIPAGTWYFNGMWLAATRWQYCSFTSGSGTAQVCDTSAFATPISTPIDSTPIYLKTSTTNTGTGFTLNANSLGVKSVAKICSGAKTTTLAAGDIISGENPMWYDGTNWVLFAPGTGCPATVANALTMNNSGSGAASGSTYNGGSAVIVAEASEVRTPFAEHFCSPFLGRSGPR